MLGFIWKLKKKVMLGHMSERVKNYLDGRRSTPNTLIRNGITKQSIKPGTVIVVKGYQSKGKLCLPRCIANGRDVTFPDGRKVFMGSSGTGAPRDGADPRERR